MRAVHLLGIGMTASLGNRAGDPAPAAASAALADAGLSPGRIDAVTIANGRDADPAHLDRLGEGSWRSPDRCVWGAAALHAGWTAVATGASDAVVCVGHDGPPPTSAGVPGIGALANAARGYMSSSGATERHFARLAAQNRAHGAARSNGFRRPTQEAVERVLASEVLAWPLRRLMVPSPAPGAAAVVLGSAEHARRSDARALRVRASVLLHTSVERRVDATARGARLAYQASALGPEDLHCAEIDGPTAACELAAYEAIQLAPAGRGPELVESGFTALDGVVPCNTSGGALWRGYGEGAGGIVQLCELALALRGEAKPRQIRAARVGLTLARGLSDTGLLPVSLMVLTVD